MPEIPDIEVVEVRLVRALRKLSILREQLHEWLDEQFDESTKAATILSIYEEHFGTWEPTPVDRP